MVRKAISRQRSAVIITMSIVWLTIATSLYLTTPANTHAEPKTTFPFSYNPAVAQMVNAVQSSDVYNYDGNLSGQFPVNVGGQSVTLTSRNLYNPLITKATQYVYEFMQARGISVSYYNWHYLGASNRDVIGVITGTVSPNEIVLITAHLDDMPETGLAPGADDDGSGSVGVMMAAARLAGHKFSRTIRFVFFTGEEYDENGSCTYAQACKAKNENLVADYNMDMIGFDPNNDGAAYLETRIHTDPGFASDNAIATVLTQVVNTYGLSASFHPSVDSSMTDPDVDSYSFWSIGYPSITAIEDWDEVQQYSYNHTSNDTLSTLNLTFFTNYVKASVGTAAHLAVPINNLFYLPLIKK